MYFEDITIEEYFNIYLDSLNIDLFNDVLIKEDINLHIINIVKFSNSIKISLQFDFGRTELLYMEGLVGNKLELRKQQVTRYYFVNRHTMSQIADALNMTYNQVYNMVKEVQKNFYHAFQKDIKKNKKPLQQMYDVIYNLEYQRTLIMNQYTTSEAELTKLRELKREADLGGISNLNQIKILQTAINDIKYQQRDALKSAREAMKQMTDTLTIFGFTGDNAAKLIIENSINVNAKMDMETFVLKAAGVLKSLLPKEQHYAAFNTLLKEIQYDEFTEIEE